LMISQEKTLILFYQDDGKYFTQKGWNSCHFWWWFFEINFDLFSLIFFPKWVTIYFNWWMFLDSINRVNDYDVLFNDSKFNDCG
jgi:hypothetical protein